MMQWKVWLVLLVLPVQDIYVWHQIYMHLHSNVHFTMLLSFCGLYLVLRTRHYQSHLLTPQSSHTLAIEPVGPFVAVLPYLLEQCIGRSSFNEVTLKPVDRFGGGTRISGTVPDAYSNLSQLEYLDLGLCNCTSHTSNVGSLRCRL